MNNSLDTTSSPGSYPRPHGPGLWLPGVAIGVLWVAGAFAALGYCFWINYQNKPVPPSQELAIANAALARTP